jgi:hypothetical protein
MQQEDMEPMRASVHFCPNRGHVGDTTGDERCHFCNALLSGPGTLYFANVLRLDNVATRRANRITSDEEERRRRGYEVKTALRLAQSTQGLDYTHAVAADAERGEALAQLTYAPTATLWRLNLGWNRPGRPPSARPGHCGLVVRKGGSPPGRGWGAQIVDNRDDDSSER